MCEYCSCRSQPSIARFGEEHDQIGAVAARLGRVHASGDVTAGEVPGATWEAVPAALARLDRHICREEYDVFPAALRSRRHKAVRPVSRDACHVRFDLSADDPLTRTLRCRHFMPTCASSRATTPCSAVC